MRAYARGLGTLTTSQHNKFDSDFVVVVVVLMMGFQPQGSLDLESTLYQLSHLSPHEVSIKY